MKLTLKEMLIYEAPGSRKKDLNYREIAKKGQIDRIVVTLQGSDSAVMSKVAGRLKRLDDAIKLMSERREELKTGWKDKKGEYHPGLREKVSELFDPADVVYTRVVDTVSFSVVLAKKVEKEPEKITDWEAVAKEFIALIDNDLEDTVNSIIEKFTSIKKVNEKEAAVRIEPIVKEGISDIAKAFIAKIKKVIGDLPKQIARWAINFDKKLDKLKQQLQEA
jgi:RNA polymerase-interacting CarD/CdnL/TRCF family regulator